MALSTPRARAWTPGRIPSRLLLVGLAAAVAVGGAYVAIAGNPLTRNQQVTTYQTAAVGQGTVQVAVAATGPITNPASVPLSFKSSGKLAEIDVAIGQHNRAALQRGHNIAFVYFREVGGASDGHRTHHFRLTTSARYERQRVSRPISAHSAAGTHAAGLSRLGSIR